MSQSPRLTLIDELNDDALAKVKRLVVPDERDLVLRAHLPDDLDGHTVMVRGYSNEFLLADNRVTRSSASPSTRLISVNAFGWIGRSVHDLVVMLKAAYEFGLTLKPGTADQPFSWPP
jgi:hypothetical protein